jgi:RNA polymerase sigma factor (sigma-70 family)
MQPAKPLRNAMPNHDFADLVARARSGDSAALTRLTEQYEPQIRRIAHRRLGKALRPYVDTMDLVQSVHFSLMLGLRNNKFAIACAEDLIGLAVKMVMRKVARRWQKVQREHEFLKLQELLLLRCRKTDDPARAAELADQIRLLLSQLDDFDRRLLQLYLEGHSTVEAARILECNPDVLRVRRSRLFRKLRARGLHFN